MHSLGAGGLAARGVLGGAGGAVGVSGVSVGASGGIAVSVSTAGAFGAVMASELLPGRLDDALSGQRSQPSNAQEAIESGSVADVQRVADRELAGDSEAPGFSGAPTTPSTPAAPTPSTLQPALTTPIAPSTPTVTTAATPPARFDDSLRTRRFLPSNAQEAIESDATAVGGAGLAAFVPGNVGAAVPEPGVATPVRDDTSVAEGIAVTQVPNVPGAPTTPTTLATPGAGPAGTPATPAAGAAGTLATPEAGTIAALNSDVQAMNSARFDAPLPNVPGERHLSLQAIGSEPASKGADMSGPGKAGWAMPGTETTSAGQPLGAGRIRDADHPVGVVGVGTAVPVGVQGPDDKAMAGTGNAASNFPASAAESTTGASGLAAAPAALTATSAAGAATPKSPAALATTSAARATTPKSPAALATSPAAGAVTATTSAADAITSAQFDASLPNVPWERHIAQGTPESDSIQNTPPQLTQAGATAPQPTPAHPYAGIAMPAAATPSGNPAQPTSQPALASQLSAPLFSLASSRPGEHVMTLRVSPEDLGPLTVRAHIDAAGVRIELFAPGDAGREAVRHILPELRRGLEDSGASLSLSLHNSPGDSSTGTGPGNGQGNNGNGARNAEQQGRSNGGLPGNPAEDQPQQRRQAPPDVVPDPGSPIRLDILV